MSVQQSKKDNFIGSLFLLAVATVILIYVMLLGADQALAKMKYNQYSGEYEVVPNNVDTSLKYNNYSGEWSYQLKRSMVEYNKFKGEYQWNMDVYFGENNEPAD